MDRLTQFLSIGSKSSKTIASDPSGPNNDHPPPDINLVLDQRSITEESANIVVADEHYT